MLDRFDTPDGEFCTVLWFGGDTTSVPMKDIKNTKAYSDFVKLDNLDLFRNNRNRSSNNNTKHKPTSRSKSTPKTSSKVKAPVAKRTRSSKGEKNRSIPHFSQSNGLVERRHRDVLQSLRRLLVDFNDYDNWSTYIPTVQLQINATKSSITGHTPYELMFGCDISPGADPSSLLDAVEKSTKNVPFIDDIKTKLERLTKQREEAEDRQSVLKPKKKSNTSQSFKIGDLVLKVVKTSKLHGNYTGPFLVVSVDSKSLFH
ncbi:hypothetical protein GEMRC1_011005 [Eukaryota sp. GEM-RC1]